MVLDLHSVILPVYSKEYVLSFGGDMRTRITAILCGFLIVLGACAPRLVPRADTKDPEGFKICSESPLETAKRFIQGVMDMSLYALRALVPDGASLLAIFGGGDKEKGKKVSEELYHHPAKLKGKEVGSVFEVKSADPDGNGTYRILIERYSEITGKNENGTEVTTEELQQRQFLASFDPKGNCLTNVRAIDSEWLPKNQ